MTDEFLIYVLIVFSSGFIFLFGYAEIHYRIPGIFSRLFRKEPEMIFDLPHRAVLNQSIPLFLFIKDAHQFPVKLLDAKLEIAGPGGLKPVNINFSVNKTISDKFVSETFFLSPTDFSQPGHYQINVKLSYQLGKRVRQLQQDNYRGISHPPFSIYIAPEPLPSLPGLYWGDLHLHSNYTEDQIEFGAPIHETAHCARSMGLHFIAITDHSYDLDNHPDNYLEKDFSYQKWKRFLNDAEEGNQAFPDFVIIPGEEVSTGNYKNQNVHCLVLGNQTFWPGDGDGGQKLLSTRPTLSVKQLVDKIQAETNFHSNPTIIAAAHPFDKPPASHRLVLNRGYWHDRDLAQPELDYWQILNGKTDNFFYKGLEAWKSALLRGNRIGILAGTDAHGNFNCSRQIAIPLLKMFRNKQQLLGQTRSGVFMEDRIDRSKLIKHLKEKRVIISNGPAAKLIVEQNQGIYAIGSSINAHVPFSVAIKAISTAEFGSLQDIHLFIGNFAEKQETREIISVEQNVFSHEASMDFPHGLPPGYLRLEAYTSNGLKDRFCLTNPVWIGQTVDN